MNDLHHLPKHAIKCIINLHKARRVYINISYDSHDRLDERANIFASANKLQFFFSKRIKTQMTELMLLQRMKIIYVLEILINN